MLKLPQCDSIDSVTVYTRGVRRMSIAYCEDSVPLEWTAVQVGAQGPFEFALASPASHTAIAPQNDSDDVDDEGASLQEKQWLELPNSLRNCTFLKFTFRLG